MFCSESLFADGLFFDSSNVAVAVLATTRFGQLVRLLGAIGTRKLESFYHDTTYRLQCQPTMIKDLGLFTHLPLT